MEALMSDAPEKVWIDFAEDCFIDFPPGSSWADREDYTPYRRADLPPTDAQIAADPRVRALVETAQWARNRLEAIADESWRGDARDFKRSLVGVFADFDAALAALPAQGGET
jgi:hypothetical protein